MDMQLKITDSGQTPAFFDWIITLLKRKRFIIIGTLVITLATVVVTLFMEPVFESTAKVLPSMASSSTQSMLSQLGAAVGASTGLSGSTTSGPTPDMLNGILKSNSVLDTVIAKYDLIKTWGNQRYFARLRPYTIDHAREKLVNDIFRTEVDSASGIVTIYIDLPDAQLSADMANTFVDELIRVDRKLATEDARQKREFYETELRKDFLALSQAEETLQGFQESSGAIQIDDQAKAVLEGIATLEAQIAAQEVQLTVMKTYATVQNPDYKRAQQQLEGLRQQRRKLEQKQEGLISSSIIPTASVPSVGMDYLRKMRDFKYYEALYLIMLKQYESLKQDEIKNVSDVWVVDRAVVPQKKASPKFVLDILIGFGAGFVFCILTAFILEYLEKSSRHPRSKRKLDEIKYHLMRV
jgi:tyrosine-protein kinase Etk/Wzc